MRLLFLITLLGASTCLLADDTLSCTGNYDNQNQKHGVWVCRNGKRVVKRERYKHGVLQTYILYDEKGEMIESRDRKGRVKKYTPCGC